MKTILWILTVSVVGLYITGPILDPDLWWHIAIGRWILENGTVPRQEYWNHFALGNPFRAYSWLFEAVVAKVYDSYAVNGLLLVKVITGQLISFSFCYLLSRLSKDYFVGLLLGIVTIVSCHSHFTLRPQSITWIILALLLLVISHTKRFQYLSIFILFSLWANLHITTIFGLIIIFLWTVDLKNISRSLIYLLAGFLGTLFTPYIGGEWLTFFSKTDHPLAHSNIVEFQAATLLQYSTGFLVFSLFLAFLLFHLKPHLFNPFKVLLVSVFIAAGLAIIKFLPFAAILLNALIAEVIGRAKSEGIKFGNLEEAKDRLYGLTTKIPNEGLGFIFLSLLVVLGYKLKQGPISYAIVPVQAVDFMASKNLPKPWLSTFGYGGYLMAHFTKDNPNPRDHVAIDGRTNVAPKEVFEAHGDASLGNRKWHNFVDMYKPNSILWRGEAPFVTLLLQSGNWCIVYEEKIGQLKPAVLIKRSYYETRINDFPNATCKDGVDSE